MSCALPTRPLHRPARSLPPLVVPLVPGAPASSALPLAAVFPPDDVVTLVRMSLRAVRPRAQFDRACTTRGIHALSDDLKVCNFHTVPVNAATRRDVINCHPVGNRPNLTLPGFTVRVRGAAQSAVTVRMMRALPTQASALRVANRRRVIIPALPPRRRLSLLPLVSARHGAVLPRPALRRDRAVAVSATQVRALAEPGGSRAGRRAEPGWRLPLGRVIRSVLGATTLAIERDVHTRHTPILLPRTAVNPDSTEGSQ